MTDAGADRVTVLIDYQNVHGWARRQFHDYGSDPATCGHIDPVRLGQLIVQRRSRPSVLQQVRVYRGRPNPERQATSARANDRQADEWSRSPLVEVVRRNLSYPSGWPATPPMEKGVDVALAVDAVRLSLTGATDVAVIFSHDKDLLPAVETLTASPRCHAEVVAWAKAYRLRLDGTQRPWCHWLSQADYETVRDRTDYSA